MAALTINGTTYEAADPGRNLLSFIRFDAGLTGTKYACGEGECGACTVLADGKPMRACQATVGAVAGSEITTIEGIGSEGALHPVQQTFIDLAATQCGYCTPGFIMTAVALLERQERPTNEQIREALSLNICRCGTYQRIIRAVEDASARSAEAGG